MQVALSFQLQLESSSHPFMLLLVKYSPGFSHKGFQVVFFFFNFYYSVCVKSLSRVRLFAIPWTVAHQAPLPMEFSRQEYWSRLSFPSPGDLPNPGTEPRSSALQADALTSEPPGKP